VAGAGDAVFGADVGDFHFGVRPALLSLLGG
jgi:hypothetical protein